MKLNLLCLFTIFWTTQYSFGQNQENIFPRKMSATLFASARQKLAIERDTSETYFYSFEEGRVVPFIKRNNNDEQKTTTVSVCETNSVMLTAPDFGEDAIYSWKGPAGFTSYSQQIMIEQVTTSQAGFYNITIKRNGTTVLGKIKVMVKEKPLALASGGAFCLGQPVKLSASEAGFGANYKWSQPPSSFTASTKDAILDKMTLGDYTFFLTVTKNGCKAMDTARVEVRQIPMANANNSIIKEGESVTLVAESAGNNAEYKWRGPFLVANNAQTTKVEGLKPGKYIYILTVQKNGCSSMNTAVVEVQKDELKASNKE
jgi:hypothetical protein